MSPAEMVRVLIGLVLDMVPHEEARMYLDEEARKRSDKIADAAEAAKFSPG